MKSIASHLRLLLIVSTLCYTTAACGQATFTPLGDLPGGLFSSGADGISADGSVSGRSE